MGADVAAILIFCALGRHSHDERVSVSGLARTSGPFLAGTLFGWLLSRGWRRPAAVAPTGVIVWVSTVVVGMLLRKASSASVAGGFVVVASTVTGVFLLGWRAALERAPELLSRRRADG
jgi:peptidoglycan/LPS O-acetylase OafA/YrhL